MNTTYIDSQIHTPELLGKLVKIERTPNANATGEWMTTINIYGTIKSIESIIGGCQFGMHIYLDGRSEPFKFNPNETQTVVKVIA